MHESSSEKQKTQKQHKSTAVGVKVVTPQWRHSTTHSEPAWELTLLRIISQQIQIMRPINDSNR